jgi:hypothetical protein
LKPATSAQGAAAQIKAEEAQAKAKIAAIEYLASVDCRYYPEAEAGMITGLRAEKNECVRLAAAKALASGCCCSAKVVKALTMTVNCSNKDGFPAEASELVRIYAFVALERCMRKCVEGEAEVPPEQPPPVKQALFEVLRPAGSEVNLDREILLAGYFTNVAAAETHARVFEEGRRTLAKGLKVSPGAIARLSHPRNVYDSIMPGGAQSHGSGPIVVTDGNAPIDPQMSGSTTTEPKLANEPARLPTSASFAGSQSSSFTPNASMPEVKPQPNPTGWSQRILPPTGNTEVVYDATPRRTGRGNLFNIFQDASRR